MYHNRHVRSGKKKKKHTLIMLFSNIWVLYFLIHELFIVFCLYTSFHKIKYKLRKLSLNTGPLINAFWHFSALLTFVVITTVPSVYTARRARAISNLVTTVVNAGTSSFKEDRQKRQKNSHELKSQDYDFYFFFACLFSFTDNKIHK